MATLLGLAGLVLVVWEPATGRRVALPSSSIACAACHEMRGEWQSWLASSHNRATCLECHRERGFSDLLPSLTDLFAVYQPQEKRPPARRVLTEAARRLEVIGGEVYAHLSNTYPRPVTARLPVADDACLKCHTLNREVTPSSDLIIPHQKHYERRVGCTSCHRGVVHPKISGRGLGGGAAAPGQGVASSRPSMEDCTRCHQRRKVTRECKACHREQKMSPEHLSPDFRKRHGSLARQQGVPYCNQCHKYTLPGNTPRVDTADPVAYARENPFCGGCHAKMPESHLGGDFSTRHGQGAVVTTCTTCHASAPGQQGAAARTNCNKCHNQARAHTQGWRARHPVQAGRAPEKSCFACHGEETCRRCHNVT